MFFGHVHPSEMGFHGIVSEGNCVLEWCSLGKITVESYLFLVGSGVDVNSGGWNFCDGLDFEGVHGNTALGNDESKEVSCSDVEHTLEGVQEDVVLTTPFEDDP
jgi:hypothetical protein